MRRLRTVLFGTLATVVVGILGTVVPVLGALAGAVAGGLYVGVESEEATRLSNGPVAGALGSVLPAYTALFVVEAVSRITITGLSYDWVGGWIPAVTPVALGFAAALGILAAGTARFGPESNPTRS